MNLRVLHLAAGNLYGGVETFLVTLARLRDLAPTMEPEFGLCFDGRLQDELNSTGVPVHHLGEVRIRHPWTVLRARRQLKNLLAERKPDVVVLHCGLWGHLVFASAIKAKKIRLVYFAHNPPDLPSLFDRWVARIRPDLVIANSRFTAASVPLIFPAVKTEVAYLPVQLEIPADRQAARTDVRKELGAADTDTVILTSCRLESWKGHALLLDALGQLRDQPGWISWIAGGAQRPAEIAYLEELKAKAHCLGISDRVKFLGQRSDIPRLLVAADIHCQPNTGPEPFGIAFVEALAAGLPVLTTAMGGALEIVDDTCGVLIIPDEPAELRNAIMDYLENKELRRQHSKATTYRAAALCDPIQQMQQFANCLYSQNKCTPANLHAN
ncbi:glycosyltransferase [bacterium]|nr:glycosyltransferase [bacterium]